MPSRRDNRVHVRRPAVWTTGIPGLWSRPHLPSRQTPGCSSSRSSISTGPRGVDPCFQGCSARGEDNVPEKSGAPSWNVGRKSPQTAGPGGQGPRGATGHPHSRGQVCPHALQRPCRGRNGSLGATGLGGPWASRDTAKGSAGGSRSPGLSTWNIQRHGALGARGRWPGHSSEAEAGLVPGALAPAARQVRTVR